MIKHIISKGDKFGKWEVIGERIFGSKNILCRCDCGTEREVSIRDLKNGKSKSCRCGFKLEIGDKFSEWEVIGERVVGKNQIKCRCSCGKESVVRITRLANSESRSCGCLQIKQMTKHGLASSLEYKTWKTMISRCYKEYNPSYKWYGAKGIRVCDRWLESIENFIEDMGNRPSKKYSIDRIDGDKDYNKENCKWSTRHEQASNTSSNRNITAFGKTLCLSEWSRKFKINYTTLRTRLLKGWDPEKALTTPPDQRYSNRRSKKQHGQTILQ